MSSSVDGFPLTGPVKSCKKTWEGILGVLKTDNMLLLLSFSLNTRFGVVAVPTILLFHSGKPVLKFNNSISLDDVRNFIKNNTGMSSCDSENKLSVKCF